MAASKTYTLYVVECCDGTLYTGITNNVDRRLIEHNASPRGAKYTRSRRPVRLVYTRQFRSKSKALRMEAAMKSLPRWEKNNIVQFRRKI